MTAPLVLGIETSCDETGVGLVRGRELLADAVASSVDQHARFGGGSQADVVTLAVDPGHWGQGIGTALLSALVDEAGRRGYTEVLLEVREDNPRARRLYFRHGFTEIGIRRGYYQPSGVDAVVMRKALA